MPGRGHELPCSGRELTHATADLITMKGARPIIIAWGPEGGVDYETPRIVARNDDCGTFAVGMCRAGNSPG